jgi:dynein heavy chain
MPGTLNYIKKNCKTLINVSNMAMVISHCRVLGGLLADDWKHLEYAFVFSLIWAVGGCLAEKDSFDYRKEFSNWWKGEWKTMVKFPSKGVIFDYYIDNARGERENEPCKFDEWSKTLFNVDFDTARGDMMSSITVPTKETIATEFFIKKYIAIGHPVLIIGFAGCGKTQLANGILRNLVREKPDNYAFQQINFNYYTDATYLQTQLEQSL